jgi:hypothetical protein
VPSSASTEADGKGATLVQDRAQKVADEALHLMPPISQQHAYQLGSKTLVLKGRYEINKTQFQTRAALSSFICLR